MAPEVALDGGFALITGVASNVGEEIAIAFAHSGAEGILLEVPELPTAEAVAEKCRKHAHHPRFRVIVAKEQTDNDGSATNLVDTAVRAFGRLDYCVHFSMTLGLRQHDHPDMFQTAIDTYVKSTLSILYAASLEMSKQEPRVQSTVRHGHMRSLGRGSIVVVNPVSSTMVTVGPVLYVACKHAVHNMVKAIAVDNVNCHIRVNSVCPYLIKSSSQCDIGSPRNLATPEDIADAVLFLSSPAARSISAESLVVDGGYSLSPIKMRLLS
ncbi:SDR family NAD(P)-dependent oxidoreductase [Aspergillus melleus]|uniref:SDR family NAD(P)-dependent oxidoreductase n=1 Tax=Aspergillus melleus TaxID=138277 RepID=UPI001E8E677A|nr:uncharacterized protein LDX57_008658 [Aspergillus melleus]KAH8430997.1 hypothetical protein LDX57_008658 [Aspergillus melleus]